MCPVQMLYGKNIKGSHTLDLKFQVRHSRFWRNANSGILALKCRLQQQTCQPLVKENLETREKKYGDSA